MNHQAPSVARGFFSRLLNELYEKLRALGPALLQENKALQATGEIRNRLEALSQDQPFPSPERAYP